MFKRENVLRVCLVLLELIIGLTAVRGGYGLLTTNGLGMPLSFLQNSPFPDYTIPALILLFIVGGANLLAAVLLFRKHRYALEAAAIAGFGLLIWVVVEQYIIPDSHFLQLIYFVLGVICLVLTMFLLKFQKRGEVVL